MSRIRLIVNADDFGFFDGVCAGILDGADFGTITATGVMANGPAMGKWIGPLKDREDLSVGIHLNATLGAPLSADMRQALSTADGMLPSRGALLSALLRGKLSTQLVLHEWRTQIEYCLQLGLKPAFLNSHEHVHMLPRLYSGVRELAREFRIQHVRAPRSEPAALRDPAAVIRCAALLVLSAAALPADVAAPRLIGLAPSGRLDLEYCRRKFRGLRAGVYELMCHPGRPDPVAGSTSSLRDYHDWEGELRTLTSPEFGDLLQENSIQLIRYQELSP